MSAPGSTLFVRVVGAGRTPGPATPARRRLPHLPGRRPRPTYRHGQSPCARAGASAEPKLPSAPAAPTAPMKPRVFRWVNSLTFLTGPLACRDSADATYSRGLHGNPGLNAPGAPGRSGPCR
jgi:hypothetical protein